MAFDRSKEAKLASIARRAARKGKDAARFAAIARDSSLDVVRTIAGEDDRFARELRRSLRRAGAR